VNGYPIRVCEMLATLDGPSYLERVCPTSPAGIIRAKKAIKRAFQNQIAGKGFSLVEVLCNCPQQWKMTPIESFQWIDENMTEVFPPGVFVTRTNTLSPAGEDSPSFFITKTRKGVIRQA